MRTCSEKLPAPSGGWPGCGGCATRPMACSTETDVPGALSMGQCRCLTQAAELAPEIGRDLRGHQGRQRQRQYCMSCSPIIGETEPGTGDTALTIGGGTDAERRQACI